MNSYDRCLIWQLSVVIIVTAAIVCFSDRIAISLSIWSMEHDPGGLLGPIRHNIPCPGCP
jgi:hypothetical protein